MVRYGMVIDLDRCMGCRACMEACKVENATPEGIFWMYVFRLEEGEYPNVRVWFVPRPCMHCDKPPCVRVCPVGATFKDENGRVMQDAGRCIGCRYCMQACPYGVRYFNDMDPKQNYYLDWLGPAGQEIAFSLSEKARLPQIRINPVAGRATFPKALIPPYRNPDLEQRYPVRVARVNGQRARLAGGGHLKGVVEKCTFCLQRVEKGLLPACVANCPVGALHFGDLDDPDSEVSRLVREKPHFRLLDEYGTQPKVYYLGSQPPSTKTRQIEPPGREAWRMEKVKA